MTTVEEEGVYSSGSYAEGWKALKEAVEANLIDITLIRIGAMDEDGQMAQDSGTYIHLLVGRT